MRLRGQDDDQIDVRMSVEELVLLTNVLREVANGMQFTEDDFQAIFGATRREVEGLHQRATGVLKHLRLTLE